MKVLITGANGYLGSRLSKYLSQNGFEVIAVCHSKNSYISEWDTIFNRVVIADLTDDKAINKVASIETDAVIHLVSLNHYDSEKEIKNTIDVNVLTTWMLLDAFSKRFLKKFIYFSTIHVYDNNYDGIITEESIPDPSNLYGLTHLLSENICNYYNNLGAIDCINIRLANSYGEPVLPNANCWDIFLNDICKTAYYKKKIILKV